MRRATTDRPEPEAATGLLAERLLERLRPYRERGLLVAFSGGLDSAVLLDLAIEALGNEGVLALTAVSPSLPAAELESARRIARELGARLHEEPTHELEDPDYVANAGRRCYYCKRELFRVAGSVVRSLGYCTVAYGYHRDDDADFRPGLAAALEAGAARPLWEAGLGKADLRALARSRGRSFAGKATFACLSSRLPLGVPVTAERLSKVEILEGWLRDRGYRQFRARLDRDDAVRLETSPDEVPRLEEELSDPVLGRALRELARTLNVATLTVDPRGWRRPGEP